VRLVLALLLEMGIELLTPYSSEKRDPSPERSTLLSCFRYRINTSFSQLVGLYSIKRVWARSIAFEESAAKKVPLTPWLTCSTIG
jgi:hypothetical protein